MILALAASAASAQNLTEISFGVFKLDEKVYFASVKKLSPGLPWKDVVPADDITNVGALKLPVVVFPDFEGEALLHREGEKHHRTLLKVSGKKACKAMLQDAERTLGKQNVPSRETSSYTEYTWKYDENFAFNVATYRVTNNRECTLRIEKLR